MHQPGRSRREYADSLEAAVQADRFEESGIIMSGRGQSRSACKTPARTIHIRTLSLRSLGRALIAGLGARVDGREAVAVGLRHIEMRVLHAERPGDPRFDEFVQRHARSLLHHAAEDI